MAHSNSNSNSGEDSPDGTLRSLISEVHREVQALREEIAGRFPNTHLFTRDEAADYLRISVRTLDDMEEAGEIQAVRIRGRVLYHQETLEAYVRRQHQRS